MNSTRGFFSWIKAAAKGLAAELRPRPPSMIGTPPSARPMWHDPPAHARDFAERYSVPLSYTVEQRMMDLGIPPDRIGMPDKHHVIQWSAFHPHGTVGGSYSPDGRLVVDSGVLNTDLLKADYDEKAARLFGESRLRDRMDAIIAHEYEEHRHGMSHVGALKAAPRTALSISDKAREICREMERGWKR